MAKAAVKLPMAGICRSLVGAMGKNEPLLQHPYRCMWGRNRGIHGIPEDGSVICLRNSVNDAEVFLVGTCHVAEKSAQLVKQGVICLVSCHYPEESIGKLQNVFLDISKVIHIVNPKIIAIELCNRRLQSLQRLKSDHQSMLQLLLNSWQFPGSPPKKLLHFYLALQYHHLRVIGLKPGKEFEVALEECKRLQAQLLLIDEDVEVTVAKLLDALSFSVILRLAKVGKRLQEMVGSVALRDAIEKFTERNFARKVGEILTAECPEIVRVLITHRDQVMFKRLRKCEGKVVGLVGMGHMDGIEQMWKDIEQKSLKDKGYA